MRTDTISTYFVDYIGAITYGLQKVNTTELIEAVSELTHSERIFVAGNGGSAAIANHLSCDFAKGSGLNVISLSTNIPIITALANDISYESIFTEQLKQHKANSLDTLILISSSGNSPNILSALNYAQESGIETIGLTGFTGGKLKEHCGISLHIPVNNYGIVEDCHQALMHTLAQYIKAKSA